MKYALAIDIGKTNLRVAVGNSDGKFLLVKKEKTVSKGNKNAIASQVLGTIKSFENLPKIEAIGIGCFGQMAIKNKKRIINADNSLFFEIDFSSLSSGLKTPMYLLNDAKAATLGESVYGVGKGVNNFVYITMSSGIGAGVFVDGKLLFGRYGNAPEPYTTVVNNYGTWIDCCGGIRMPKFYKHLTKNKEIITTKEIFDRAKKGDKKMLEFLDEVGKINAIGFATIINFFDPELVIIGGATALNNKKVIMSGIKKYLKNYTNYNPEFKFTKLGDDVGLYGGLTAAFDKIGYRI